MEEELLTDLPPVHGERVLIVEDDPPTRTGLAELVQAWGFYTDEAVDGEDALRKVTTFRPAIIVSDLVMPRMGGRELLKSLRDQLSDITFILLTAQGTVESAVEAIKEGAYDYLSKPVDPNRLRILLQKSMERQSTLREVRTLRRQLRDSGSFGRIIGNSAGIRSVYRIIEQAAPTHASVLISGESGTGKELIAQTIHELSPRATFPFVAINCAAIPETLLESEIFGHEKGAFTGAHDRRTGVFELAHRGTLFLDEIAEMQPATQVKLLRVLQERRFRRLGGTEELHVDLRVVAATNQDLARLVAEGRFREDLFYRINVIPLHLPPLRERRGDVALLADHFLAKHAKELEKPVRAIAQDAMALLDAYSWPGNVRELENVIERCVALERTEAVLAETLPLQLRAAVPMTDLVTSTSSMQVTNGGNVARPAMPEIGAGFNLEARGEEFYRHYMALALERAGGVQIRAAEMLGMSFRSFRYYAKKLKLR
jgi:two-component system response regulator HydG